MKLTDKAKKRFIITALVMVCVVLVIAIISQFKTEEPKDASVQPSSTISDAISPSIVIPAPSEDPIKTPEVTVQPINPAEASTKPADSGDSTGTEQSMQAEVTKPTQPPQEVKADPSKTPDGGKVDTVKPVEHDKVTKPANNTSPSEPKSGDKNEKGQVWVPGFGWVDDSGPNKGITVDGEGDINKQVGNMD